MYRAAVLLAASCAAAVSAAAAQAPPRVVSLDYCADQYVLALADRDQILAVSTQADDPHSHMRAAAAGLPQVRDAAEDVLTLQPDLIVRAYGGGPRAAAYYARLGLPVHDLGYAADFDAIETMIRDAAAALGHPARADALIARMRDALEAAAEGPRASALYVTPSGATGARGTLVHEILRAAGFDNAAAGDGERGWRTLPLEAIAEQSPDVVVAAYFNDATAPPDSWSPGRHRVFRDLMTRTPTVHLDGALVSCAAWYTAEAALDVRRQYARFAAPDLAATGPDPTAAPGR